MTNPCFLADECVSAPLVSALRRRQPLLDLVQVGEAAGPPKGTSDPDLLWTAEGAGRIFLSDDKKSLPRHIAVHYAAGRHTCGVLLMRQGFTLARFLNVILLIWHTTTPDEWVDEIVYLPY